MNEWWQNYGERTKLHLCFERELRFLNLEFLKNSYGICGGLYRGILKFFNQLVDIFSIRNQHMTEKFSRIFQNQLSKFVFKSVDTCWWDFESFEQFFPIFLIDCLGRHFVEFFFLLYTSIHSTFFLLRPNFRDFWMKFSQFSGK